MGDGTISTNGSVAEWSNASDCKSDDLWSTAVRIRPGPHPANIAQSVERIHGKDEVRGSIPRVGSATAAGLV